MNEIRFLANRPHTMVEFDPPVSSTRTVPEWYKKIPLYLNQEKTLRVIPATPTVNVTVKSCTPFLDAMSFGYSVVLADDVQVQNIDGQQTIWWRTGGSLVTEHSSNQHPGLPVAPFLSEKVWKWANEWRIVTPSGYSTFFTSPINRPDLPFTNFTGVVDTDLFELPVQFPFRLVNGFEGIIEKGTPISQFFPFKRESWVSKTDEFDELRVMRSSRQFFGKIERAYKSRFWVKKTFQ
jgi:hypothetical protein